MNRPFSKFLHTGILSLFLILTTLTSCKNECKDVDCQNGGICDDGTCLCPEKFSGDQCQYIAVSALFGEYDCGAECTDSEYGQPIIRTAIITPSPNGGNNIIISIGQVPLNATVSGNEVIIEGLYNEFEDSEGNIIGTESLVGEGDISNGILYMQYIYEYTHEYGPNYSSDCQWACPIDL